MFLGLRLRLYCESSNAGRDLEEETFKDESTKGAEEPGK
jgi:hypothetical protein